MILEVITPDEVLYKGNVSQVVLPGLDGSFGILDSHAPLISALAKGDIRVDQNVADNKDKKVFDGVLNEKYREDNQFTFPVNGGVIEVFDNKILVLAE